MSNITIKDAAKMLSEAQNILLVSHIRPDGDTLGSAFGLKTAMEACGHKVNVICADEIPQRLRFLTEAKSELREGDIRGFKPDIVCSVDAAEPELMGDYGYRNQKFDLKLDHHARGSEYAKFNYIEGDSAACAEVIFKVIRELEAIGHAKLTPWTATSLYAALTSDTGCFKYSSVTSQTMRIAAELIDAEADCETVCRRLFETRSVNETVATRMMLNNLNMYRSGTMAVITISNEMKEENGLSDEDLGGLGAYLREIEGIQLAIVIKQSSDDPYKFRISMRSGPEVDASRMCEIFGGGGHARAAGASISADSPEDAEYKITEAVQSVIGFR